MIYTVTLNPAIDYVISPDSFEKGQISRYRTCTYGPGGKGANVSLLLTSLGVRNAALGIAAGFSGQEIIRLLEQTGCETHFLLLDEGHSRVNIKICTPDGEETDLNGNGPPTPPEKFEEFLGLLSDLAEGDTLVLAGSIPESLPLDVYARILKKLEGTGTQVVVDATGDSLLQTLSYRPYLIKPNHEELGELFGVAISDPHVAKSYALQLVAQGAQNVVVSLGDKGALWVDGRGRALFCRAVPGKAVSTVGAGDSLVAGLLYGLGLHGTPEGALRWGVAAGAATAFSKGIASGAQVKTLFLQAGNPGPI